MKPSTYVSVDGMTTLLPQCKRAIKSEGVDKVTPTIFLSSSPDNDAPAQADDVGLHVLKGLGNRFVRRRSTVHRRRLRRDYRHRLRGDVAEQEICSQCILCHCAAS